jgi:hypothetical protein
MKKHIALFAVFATTSAAPAAAQDRALRERTVPIELVEALLGSRPGQTVPIVLVGELPPQMKTMFVPPSSRIVGSMSSSANAVAVIASSLDPASLRREYARDATARGWKPFESTGDGSMGGFRDVSSTGPLNYCDGGTNTQIVIGPGRIGESRVTITQSAEGYCNYLQNQAQQMRAMPDPMFNIRWPVLVNPENTRSMGDCGFGRGPSFTQPAELRTGLTASQLLDHYGTQLQQLGWSVGPNLDTRTWIRTDTLGFKMGLELSVQTVPPNCKKVYMRTSSWR